MNRVINIPSVDRDERIGSAFNHLFHVIQQTDTYPEKEITWDLCNTSFFHPFFLAPLVIYKQTCRKNIKCINIPLYIADYLRRIHFEKPLFIDEHMNLEQELKEYISKSYIPICQFELCKNHIDGLQSILQKVIRQQSKADYRITTPLSYFLSELVDNMKEHSKGRYGYIFSQYLPREKSIDLVLADDGITIYKNYISLNKYLNEINGDESIALKLANEGKSTKNRPEAENRGYGISSSKKMLINGLHGSFFMLSGGAFHRDDTNKGGVFVKLPNVIRWDGTIVLMRIPVNVPKDFDYNNYTK